MISRHWNIAYRNIFKNRTRSLLSVLVVTASSIAIIVFWGFTEEALDFMKKVAADQQYGHLQIATQQYWDRQSDDRKDLLLMNHQQISEELKSIPDIKSISGRISFFGLISTGDTTTTAQFVGISPTLEPQFRDNLVLKSGQYFSSETADEILISPHFSRILNVNVGQKLTIVANSIDGIINAREYNIVGIYSTSLEEIDNFTFYMPVSQAQKILDTDAFDFLTIRTESLLNAQSTKKAINQLIQKKHPQLQVKTWYELGLLYRQVESFYQIQNFVVLLIIGLLVVLGIGNIIGINIHERTGEIGTIRSLGETRSSIVKIFSYEGFLVGVIGSIIGAILATAIIAKLNYLKIMTDMPGASEPVAILFKYSAKAYTIAFVTNISLTIVASILPSVRASRIQIVEALRKNI